MDLTWNIFLKRGKAVLSSRSKMSPPFSTRRCFWASSTWASKSLSIPRYSLRQRPPVYFVRRNKIQNLKNVKSHKTRPMLKRGTAGGAFMNSNMSFSWAWRCLALISSIFLTRSVARNLTGAFFFGGGGIGSSSDPLVNCWTYETQSIWIKWWKIIP